MSAPVIIVDYDPEWLHLFELEQQALRDALGDGVTIEHVGSTSVPELAAKPVIDIMIGVARLTDAAQYITPLEQSGYEYVPQYEEFIPDRRYFRKGSPEGRTYQLHIVERSSDFWERLLLFRDWLRAHPDDAAAYAALKRQLAARYGADRDGYTDAKTEFIRKIEQRAREARLH